MVVSEIPREVWCAMLFSIVATKLQEQQQY